jgi:NitT/TauT family transport system permease protein
MTLHGTSVASPMTAQGIRTLSRFRQGRSRGGSPRRRILSFALANGVPLLVLLTWYLAAPHQPEYLLPPPADVLGGVKEFLVGDLRAHTLTSLVRITIAMGLAMVVGAALILVTQVAPWLDSLIGGRILPLLNAVPGVGWAILGVIWLGVSDSAVVFVVTLILLPFTMVTLREGLKAIDPDLREMGRSFTRSRLAVLSRIELPLLLPYILAATRLSFSVGWKVAIIAEFFGAEMGLGLVMNQARQNFQTSTVFASIITVVIIVFVVEGLILDPLGNWVAKRSGTVNSARTQP